MPCSYFICLAQVHAFEKPALSSSSALSTVVTSSSSAIKNETSKDAKGSSRGGTSSEMEAKLRDFGLGGKDWHLFSLEKLYAELDTCSTGLTSQEAAAALLKYGPNLITPPKTTHWFIKFLLNLVSGFQLMLWAGAIMCFIVYGINVRLV